MFLSINVVRKQNAPLFVLSNEKGDTINVLGEYINEDKNEQFLNINTDVVAGLLKAVKASKKAVVDAGKESEKKEDKEEVKEPSKKAPKKTAKKTK